MRNIFLNDFRASVVFDTIDILLANDESLILAEGMGISLEDARNFEYLKLFYDSMFHRIIIYPLWLSEPLFSNPDTICEIASQEAFLREAKPTEEYYKLFISML
jgi:hypothetical protein